MQLYQLFAGLSLVVVCVGKLVCGAAYFEGSDFVNEHTLSTLLNVVDQAFTSDSFQSASTSEKTKDTFYSESGSIALIIAKKSIAGFVVNKCANTFKYSFKVQIASDSCDGGLVQYYSDFDCTTYAGCCPISAVMDGVARLKAADVAIKCSAAAITGWAPAPTHRSVAALYYEGKECSGAVTEYRAQGVGTCFPQQAGFASYTCNDAGYPQLNTYGTDSCEGTPLTVSTLTGHCLPVDDLYDFEDAPPRAPGAQDATFVGNWAQSVRVRCTGGMQGIIL